MAKAFDKAHMPFAAANIHASGWGALQQLEDRAESTMVARTYLANELQ